MSSIKEIINANSYYEKINNEALELLKKTCKINDELDLEEVKEKLNYKDTKELYEIIEYRINNKEKIKRLKEIMQEKKSKEYPQINDVHYYPEINNADFLSKEEKISLDLTIKLAYKNARKTREIDKLNPTIIKFLLENSIIERTYIFHCNCDSSDCYERIISQERFDKLKDYWIKEKEGTTTKKEDAETNFGCFEVICNEGNIEICSLEDFNKYLKRIEYKVIKEPNMSLDKI